MKIFDSFRILTVVLPVLWASSISFAQTTSQNNTTNGIGGNSSGTVPSELPLKGVSTFGLGGTTNGQSQQTQSEKDRKYNPNIKWKEYVSYCLEDEFNDYVMLPEDKKEKRLTLIKDKLQQAVTNKNDKQISLIVPLLLEEYFKRKDYTKAEEYFKEYQLKLSESDRVSFSAAIDSYRGKYKTAQSNIENYLEKNPKDISVLERLGTLQTLQKYYTEAVSTYQDLAKLNPKKSYLELLCYNSMLHSDHEGTYSFCQKLKKEQPENFKADIYIGISNRDKVEFAASVKNFDASLKIKPTEYAYTCKGETLFLKKDFEQAVESFAKAIEIAPKSARAHLGMALAQTELKKYEDALKQFELTCENGKKPMTDLASVMKTLKETKSPLEEKYFQVIRKCQQIRL